MTNLVTFLLQHMLAGAIAGISEHIAMYPMDTIKTRMQALGHPGQRVQLTLLFDHLFFQYAVLCLTKCSMVVQLRGSTVPRAIAAVLKREGIAGLYGGVGVTTWAAGLASLSPSQILHCPCAYSPHKCVLAAMSRSGALATQRMTSLLATMHVRCYVCRPAHALYFATYELAKRSLGGNSPGHHPVATAVAGSIATIINDGVMTPSDVVKQRLQVANSPYRGMVDCILRVSREEGPSAFFKSYRTTVRFHSFLLYRKEALCTRQVCK